MPTPEERGLARDLADHIIGRARNGEPVTVPTLDELVLLASTLMFYIPILEAAWKIAKHWHDQEGINVALLDDLVDECYRESRECEREAVCNG